MPTVPPIPLFAVFGELNDSPRRLTRKRIICVDDEGAPWVVGEGTYQRADGSVHDGHKTLRLADSYSDFLHIEEAEGLEDREERRVIPAAAGWRCVFAIRDGDAVASWIRHVAAWEVRSTGALAPIVKDEDAVKTLDPPDWWCTDASVFVTILEPDEAAPSDDELRQLAPFVK